LHDGGAFLARVGRVSPRVRSTYRRTQRKGRPCQTNPCLSSPDHQLPKGGPRRSRSPRRRLPSSRRRRSRAAMRSPPLARPLTSASARRTATRCSENLSRRATPRPCHRAPLTEDDPAVGGCLSDAGPLNSSIVNSWCRLGWRAPDPCDRRSFRCWGRCPWAGFRDRCRWARSGHASSRAPAEGGLRPAPASKRRASAGLVRWNVRDHRRALCLPPIPPGARNELVPS
jgi:hypothetical protein